MKVGNKVCKFKYIGAIINGKNKVKLRHLRK